MENFSDRQLIKLYLEGNQKAFSGIINRYGQVIYRFVFNLIYNSDDAHDIAQETFIKIWKNIQKFDFDKNFKTWLFTIARRTTIDYLRKRKNVSFSSLDDQESEIFFEETIVDDELLAHEIFEADENIKLVQKALETISVNSRTIVLLHNGEEMTFEEIAKIVDKPMNTIKSQYRRSIFAIKAYIENQIAPKP